MHIVPNAKCQRVLVLALWLVMITTYNDQQCCCWHAVNDDVMHSTSMDMLFCFVWCFFALTLLFRRQDEQWAAIHVSKVRVVSLWRATLSRVAPVLCMYAWWWTGASDTSQHISTASLLVHLLPYTILIQYLNYVCTTRWLYVAGENMPRTHIFSFLTGFFPEWLQVLAGPKREPLRISTGGFFTSRCPSCHPISSVEALKEIQKQWPQAGIITHWPQPVTIH